MESDQLLTAGLESDIAQAMTRDRHALSRRLWGIRRALEQGRPFDIALSGLERDVAASVTIARGRKERVPAIAYPPQLPVSQSKDAIAAAIREHQVIVVCGETGSGKTTQLPKICLELGRGVCGMIGHTQPRRIAARTVAARIASELDSVLGEAVGYKVRFSDRHSSENTYIKLMTDGILLAETQGDRFLSRYDTLIIDEAHERSLNIDFLLGYLKQLLPKRPDLKLIVTSATINPKEFSDHFGGAEKAPIIEVSGRMYPVEVRYRDPHGVASIRRDEEEEEDEEQDPDPIEAILGGIDEVWRDSRGSRGDVLIFLSGEREIRETSEALRDHYHESVEVLPLYARLSVEEQMKVFASHNKPRIVLATNVAETSLTVPGIKYVIDPGFARISRWSPRTKVQRLPIERISQASADQRKGRCGRVSEGICVRLYSEEDFASRAAFTEPEIARTNLASVILQMKALNLGEVQDFPFIQPPDYRAIKDGLQTLHELGATDEHNQLTPVGRALSRLPIDPRLGRMILAAADEDCLEQVLILAAVLSIQDPRERPMDKQQQADEAHARFADEQSDFLALLKIWSFYQGLRDRLSSNKLRKACKENFLSYVRMREWDDVHQQLKTLAGEILHPRHHRHFAHSSTRELSPRHIDAIHRALLTGLLSNIGTRTETREYLGARGIKFSIFPGSGLFKRNPAWVMTAELVETTKLYARTVAIIQPRWLERVAAHLVKRSYTEPHWQRLTGHVAAYEKVTLFGLPIIARRTVHYGPIDPEISRQLFIHHALVLRDWSSSAEFFLHNNKLIDAIRLMETKRRSRDLLVEEQRIYDFYDRRIPRDIYNAPLFDKWRHENEKHRPALLFMHERDLLRTDFTENKHEFPDEITVAGSTYPLTYVFDPSQPDDGVTATIPLAALNQVPEAPFEWLVPGLLREKVIALMKSMPKPLRVKFIPVPEHADRAIAASRLSARSLLDELATQLGKLSGEPVDRNAFNPSELPPYLQMNFRITDESGETVTTGRDLAAIKMKLGLAARRTFAQQHDGQFHRDHITSWDFGDLPDHVEIRRNTTALIGYPALVDAGKSVSLRLMDNPETARQETRAGVRRLLSIQLQNEINWLDRKLSTGASPLPPSTGTPGEGWGGGFARTHPHPLPHPPTPRSPRQLDYRGREKSDINQMCLNYSTVGSADDLKLDLIDAIVDRALFPDNVDVRTRDEFLERARYAWRNLATASDEITTRVSQILAQYQSLNVELSKDAPPALASSYQDMRSHLRELIYDHFITQTPPDWLAHYPRYLQGIEVRLRKLHSAGLARDQSATQQIAPLLRQYHERRAQHRQLAIVDVELEQYWWMLQEYRVSLFAQELKTSIPISLKRLETQWGKVK